MASNCLPLDKNKDLTFKEQNHTFSPKIWIDLYQSQDTSNKALINLLDDDELKESTEFSKWSDLPDLLLETVFSYLTIRERYYSSLVCKNWYRAFHLPKVWSEFTMTDSTLTRARFNYYEGWQYVLDHMRAQLCLSQIGGNFRKLVFAPMLNFYNLFEFMNMISWYKEQARDTESAEFVVGGKIKTLKYSFACDINAMNDINDSERFKLFGTGGKLLESLKRLMRNLTMLKRLELINLRLSPEDAQYLLDDICDICGFTLKNLILVNTTALRYQLLHVGVFLNLQILVISPQNLGNESLELLGHTKLKHLHLYQNRHTTDEENIIPVAAKSWKLCRSNNPNLKVHLELETDAIRQIIMQEGAPVKSIVFDAPCIKVQNDDVVSAIDMYRNELQLYGHRNFPVGSPGDDDDDDENEDSTKESKRNSVSIEMKPFDDRADSSLVLLLSECTKITTLVVNEPISTSTILILAKTGKNLRNLYIRRKVVQLKCDWPSNSQYSEEYLDWISQMGNSYESVEKEISKIIGYKWTMLTDRQFKYLRLGMYTDY